MNILIADDEKGLRMGMSRLFERLGFTVHQAENTESALALVEEHDIHAALIDIRLGGEDGVALLKRIKENDSEIICIMITGYGSIGNAVEAMRAGAADYLLKPVDNDYLIESVTSRLELKKLKAENDYLRTEQQTKSLEYDFDTVDPVMEKIMQNADRVKDTDTSVLITGESGTGKEVLCRYIHFSSNRANAPFVGVNCAALSDTLLLSELFGHEKGSFTGAYERKIGKFELAHGGTLFLDEIGDMPLEAQAKLLRVLEESSFERLGGNKTIKVDIRVVAATNQNLKELMEQKKFRRDLYYRLNVITLDLPPLRQRKEDILRLADYFRGLYGRKFRKQFSRFTEISEKLMTGYDWPGNIRELRNVIHQAILMGESEALEVSLPRSAQEESEEIVSETLGGTLQKQMDEVAGEIERRVIQKTLEKHRFNRSLAAQELGITRKTLFNKINKYGL